MLAVLHFLLGLASGIVVSLLLRFIEPLARWTAKFGRRVAKDIGCDVYVTSEHARTWAGSPAQWMTWSFRVPDEVLNEQPPADLRG